MSENLVTADIVLEEFRGRTETTGGAGPDFREDWGELRAWSAAACALFIGRQDTTGAAHLQQGVERFPDSSTYASTQEIGGEQSDRIDEELDWDIPALGMKIKSEFTIRARLQSAGRRRFPPSEDYAD